MSGAECEDCPWCLTQVSKCFSKGEEGCVYELTLKWTFCENIILEMKLLIVVMNVVLCHTTRIKKISNDRTNAFVRVLCIQ